MLNKKLESLQQERAALGIRIKQIQDRLTSGYSKPLEESLTALLKQDMVLISQETEVLISLSTRSSVG